MDYRRFYIASLSIEELSPRFVVHHIDYNRDNNELSNLVALPRKLHNDLHEYYNKLPINISLNKELKGIIDAGNGYHSFIFTNIRKYCEVYYDASMWLDYKYYMLGFIDNVHDLTYLKDD